MPVPPYRAQLAMLVGAAPRGDVWIHEIKYDGYRIGCRVEGGRIGLVSRRGQDWTRRFPEVIEALSALRIRDALLDGEVAAVLPDGRTSFQDLQIALGRPPPRGLAYFVFDLLHLEGEDLAHLALEARKATLARLLSRFPGPVPAAGVGPDGLGGARSPVAALVGRPQGAGPAPVALARSLGGVRAPAAAPLRTRDARRRRRAHVGQREERPCARRGSSS